MNRNNEALARLRTGGSFEDASRASGLTIETVMQLWRDENTAPTGRTAIMDGPAGPEFGEALG